MFYELNVSLNGSHYFATHERSLTNKADAKAAYTHFKALFPQSEGYKVSAQKCCKMGEDVTFD